MLADFLAQFVTPNRLALFERVLEQRTRHLTVVLEDIRHAHNASACLRTCDCFGVQDVHVIENRSRYRVNADVVLGSSQWLTLVRHNAEEDNTRPCLESLKQRGYRIIATTPHEGDCRLEEYDVTRQKTALVFGSELEGLSPVALEQADGFLRIPMYGFTESFNVSVSVALCLHHLTLRLRESEVDWRLPDEEKPALRTEWIRRTLRSRLPQLEYEFHRRNASPAR